ncbi:hypothetical protein HN371_08415 [Candidatus Poribacteria bacterium]|jgi:hypothetical protein|nr:hypothetical protein [Candidatus Poribacteria bacterium]MBT5535417.1 hypothetical protein [Candidatus Poribacteria bacterium]MBT5709657.1 hypothetical protein [Candidatus Poribacteria bacterium]MBT7100968.1 hypothetical protein [Candidatus Poribacteria bacterium]MBT7809027.1 hypothetical protein [Candidatus Poribacteria bacterium]
MNRIRFAVVGGAAALSFSLLAGTAPAVVSATELHAEDFEGVTLGANVDEGVAGAAVWTADAPAGWSVANDGAMPTNGVTEWLGWTFPLGTWWAEAAGDQERTQFTDAGKGGFGIGVVAVADPDEYDDLNSALDGGPFDSTLSSPAIDVSGTVADSVMLTFDSSWRPEDTQAAMVTVAYDGGAAMEVLRFDPDGSNTTVVRPLAGTEESIADPAQVNESVTVALGNPEGASSLVIGFRMYDATNDWWWAIDNIRVTGDMSDTAVDADGKLTTAWGTLKQR